MNHEFLVRGSRVSDCEVELFVARGGCVTQGPSAAQIGVVSDAGHDGVEH
jgi:hypothetical protein